MFPLHSQSFPLSFSSYIITSAISNLSSSAFPPFISPHGETQSDVLTVLWIKKIIIILAKPLALVNRYGTASCEQKKKKIFSIKKSARNKFTVGFCCFIFLMTNYYSLYSFWVPVETAKLFLLYRSGEPGAICKICNNKKIINKKI